MSARSKWTITIDVTEVKGGAGIEFRVDTAVSSPPPIAETICGVLRYVMDGLMEEAMEAGRPISPVSLTLPAFNAPMVLP